MGSTWYTSDVEDSPAIESVYDGFAADGIEATDSVAIVVVVVMFAT